MRCKACDCPIEARVRNVMDETGYNHVLQEDMCSYCIGQSKLIEQDDEQCELANNLWRKISPKAVLVE